MKRSEAVEKLADEFYEIIHDEGYYPEGFNSINRFQFSAKMAEAALDALTKALGMKDEDWEWDDEA